MVHHHSYLLRPPQKERRKEFVEAMIDVMSKDLKESREFQKLPGSFPETVAYLLFHCNSARQSRPARWHYQDKAMWPPTRTLNNYWDGEDSVWMVIPVTAPRWPPVVVQVFAHKWLIYDRYDKWRLQRPSSTGAQQAGGVDTDAAPNTVWANDKLSLDQESLRWYEGEFQKRDALAEEIKAGSGEVEFSLGDSLRVTWLTAQRLDPTLCPMFTAKVLDDGYRIAGDGLLERRVKQSPPIEPRWVPIVPAGHATAHLPWKRWMFLQCHVGVLGAHRSPEKSLIIIQRQAWWRTMSEDVKSWCDKCITCLRFRRMATKRESPAVVPVTAECWEEVMIDLEGPYSPKDKQNCCYSMTYICCLCHAILTDKAPKCNAQEARRMFATCMLRSGTVPSMLRSDRGPELKNAVMS